jgi:hypothetical protein
MTTPTVDTVDQQDHSGDVGRPKKPAAQATTQVAFRWPDAFIDRIDRHLTRLGRLAPGLELTRADAVRSLITDALDRAEAADEAKPPTKGGK